MTAIRLTKNEIEQKIEPLNNWVHQSQELPGSSETIDMLFKMYPFEDFTAAKRFVDRVSEIANKVGHYPGINFTESYVQTLLWTPDLKGLTENDFALAKEIDGLDQPAMEKEKFQPKESE
jgi:4a-hydroxytetrahydrobiopterin dehydratase